MVVASEVVTIIAADAQEKVDIDLGLLGSVRWPSGEIDSHYTGPGTKRWLSGNGPEVLREALLSVVAERPDDTIATAVELLDCALSTRTGVAVILP